MGIKLLLGYDNFAEMRKTQNHYVDKTGIIEEILSPMVDDPEDVGAASKVLLFARPRRFGKSLTMDMLSHFFDITKDSRELFQGLEISNKKAICDYWMNQHPVILLSMKDIVSDSWESTYENFAYAIAWHIDDKYKYLVNSDKIQGLVRKDLIDLSMNEAKRHQVQYALKTLCKALYLYHEKKVILLIDEYDILFADAYQNGFYDSIVNFMRIFYSSALKGNEYLNFSILAGCLRMGKESILTGLNNLHVFDISSNEFSASFGFTECEVDILLEKLNLQHKKQDIVNWYDGYIFGEHNHIFCPWGIIHYLRDLEKNPNQMPLNYWVETSSRSLIKTYVSKKTPVIEKGVSSLLDNGYIETNLQPLMNYDDDVVVDSSYFWTLMYLAGYLTKASEEKMRELQITRNQGQEILVIPNKEVEWVWISQVKQWFVDGIDAAMLLQFLDAFWKADTEKFENLLTNLLMKSFSYHDFGESTYHAMLTTILSLNEEADSNREAGLGRYDIKVCNNSEKIGAIVEIKKAQNKEELDNMAQKAMKQIRDKKYDFMFVESTEISKIYHWGIAFCGKQCKALVKTFEKNV